MFIPQVVYKHGEPWWNDVYRGKLLISIYHSSLAIPPAESSSSKTGGIGKGNYEFGLTKYLCSYFKGFFNMPENLMT
jgi:hypothetical protein